MREGKSCFCSRASFHWALLKFFQNYNKISVSIKALKIFEWIDMNIHVGKTIETIQLLELSLGNGKTRSTAEIMLLRIKVSGKHYLTKRKPDLWPTCSKEDSDIRCCLRYPAFKNQVYLFDLWIVVWQKTAQGVSLFRVGQWKSSHACRQPLFSLIPTHSPICTPWSAQNWVLNLTP